MRVTSVELHQKLGQTIDHALVEPVVVTKHDRDHVVILSAKRAREINSYYQQLGEGRAEFIPPLVESGFQTKPLSIALEEIAEGKVEAERPEPTDA